jgi:hypothetical protein
MLPEGERLDGAGRSVVKIGDHVVETVVFMQGEVFIQRVVHARHHSVEEIDADGRATTAGPRFSACLSSVEPDD